MNKLTPKWLALIFLSAAMLVFFNANAQQNSPNSFPERGFVSLKPATHWEHCSHIAY